MPQPKGDREKQIQEKLQAYLCNLLKEEDNKYCVDCDGKGPRWASWSLGIFLCIRCAGIHRNLGVHISKVKSVNLDSWNPDQIAMMQEIGNSRARAVYEAHIPDGFRRPQTDSALEAFIRAKYESKKYMAREWVPPKPSLRLDMLMEDDRKKKSTKPAAAIKLSAPGAVKREREAPSKQPAAAKPSAPPPVTAPVAKPAPRPPQPPAPSQDLLALDDPVPAPAGHAGNTGDLLGDLLASPQAAPASASNDLLGGVSPQQQPGAAQQQAASQQQGNAKDSIMALFGNMPQQQQQQPQQYPQMQGMMGQQQQQPMMGGGGVQQMGGVMPNMMQQQNMMAMQQQQQQQRPQMMMNGGNMGMQGMQNPNMMMGGNQGNMMARNQGVMMGAGNQSMMGGNQAMMGGGNQAMFGGGNQNGGMMGGNQNGGMMGGNQNGGMMGAGNQGMMGAGNQGMMGANQAVMGNMMGMGMTQQAQMQSVQQQMSAMKLQAAPSSDPWAQSGHTLANNLWQ